MKPISFLNIFFRKTKEEEENTDMQRLMNALKEIKINRNENSYQ